MRCSADITGGIIFSTILDEKDQVTMEYSKTY